MEIIQLERWFETWNDISNFWNTWTQRWRVIWPIHENQREGKESFDNSLFNYL